MLWTPKEEEPGSSIHSMLNMYKIKWKKDISQIIITLSKQKGHNFLTTTLNSTMLKVLSKMLATYVIRRCLQTMRFAAAGNGLTWLAGSYQVQAPLQQPSPNERKALSPQLSNSVDQTLIYFICTKVPLLHFYDALKRHKMVVLIINYRHTMIF